MEQRVSTPCLRCAAAVILAGSLFHVQAARAQGRVIDFRYSPESYFAAVCLPDDWQKSVVTEGGSLAFDFGPGPYARPLTEISLGVKGRDLTLVRKGFRDPRAPVFEATFSTGKDSVHETIFAARQGSSATPENLFLDGKLQRLEGLVGAIDWASPGADVDPAFRTVAWGVNRPVRYRVRLLPGSAKLVALGFCEPYKEKAGLRPLEAQVEGAESKRIDPLRDGERNTPGVLLLRGRDTDGDGWLSIEVHAPADGPDPHTILSALWVFPPEAAIVAADLISGVAAPKAELFWDCGRELERQAIPPRVDVILGVFSKDGGVPTVTVRSRRILEYDGDRRLLLSDGKPFLTCTPAPDGARKTGNDWVLELPPGTRQAGVVVMHGAVKEVVALDPGAAGRVLDRTRRYWNSASPVPRRSLFLPDPQLQFLFDANTRNLYQNRERVDGVLQFQPGPSVYRGLWVHDAVYHVQAALMLGDTGSAREAVEGIMNRQLSSGQVKVCSPYPMHRETACALTMMCRYAEYADNPAWLQARWTSLRKGIEWLWDLRRSTFDGPDLSYRGLFPPGFADGGITGTAAEYGTPLWTLIALKAAREAALWIGEAEDARVWQSRFDELMRSFAAASRRDARRDDRGNLYLPLNVADTLSSRPPAQAQWAMVDAIGEGDLFGQKDSLASGTLTMLRDHTRHGLTLDAGYLSGGVWAWFGAMSGMAHIAMRQYREAADILYAYANHASPYGTWVEEQMPRGEGTKTAGDGSNASASALLIAYVRRFLVYERDGSVELLAGVPTEWLRPGSRLEVADLPTRFGRISLRLQVAADKSEIALRVSSKPRSGMTGGIRLHTGSLAGAGFLRVGGRPMANSLTLSWGEKKELRFTP